MAVDLFAFQVAEHSLPTLTAGPHIGDLLGIRCLVLGVESSTQIAFKRQAA